MRGLVGLDIWAGILGTGERFPSHLYVVLACYHRKPEMLVAVGTMQNNFSRAWVLLICSSVKDENSLFSMALNTVNSSIWHLASCFLLTQAVSDRDGTPEGASWPLTLSYTRRKRSPARIL
jgi:hypothetical protein